MKLKHLLALAASSTAVYAQQDSSHFKSTQGVSRLPNMVMVQFPAGPNCNAHGDVAAHLTARNVAFKPRTYTNTKLFCGASFEVDSPDGKLGRVSFHDVV